MVAKVVADVARLIGDPARAQILVALLDVEALPASELARRARISPQTASSHLGKLCGGGLLEVEARGRSRFYRIARPEVAQAVEALMVVSGPDGDEPAATDPEPIMLARTCYDHLAGRAGVALADGLVSKGWLEVAGPEYVVTATGEAGMSELGIDVASLRKLRRQFAKRCLDWTERRYHVAGALGAALTETLFNRNWMVRLRASRVVRVTPDGYAGLRETWGVRL